MLEKQQFLDSFHENKSATPSNTAKNPSSFFQSTGRRETLIATIVRRYRWRNIEKPGRKIKPRIICQDLSNKIYEACVSKRRPTRLFFSSCSKTLCTSRANTIMIGPVKRTPIDSYRWPRTIDAEGWKNMRHESKRILPVRVISRIKDFLGQSRKIESTR